MRNRHTVAMFTAFAVALTACSDANEPSLSSEAELTDDAIVVAGDIIADDVGELILNENFAGLPAAAPGFGLFGSPAGSPPGVTVTRSRICYDANDAVQAQCDDLTTSYIEIAMTLDGSFSRQGSGPRGSHSMQRVTHRARALTISGLLGTETSRTHDGHGTSADTTTITVTQAGNDATMTRKMSETALDSVKAVVFNLPRANNPWPVSGQIVRVAQGTAEVTVGDRTDTRSYSRRIVVTFPADAQGNVAIEVNGRSCTLNLVTKAITNCS